MSDRKNTTLDIFDYIMERDSDIGTNIRETYPSSICIEKDGVIYLLADDLTMSNDESVKNFKITIEEVTS
jgi:hypothetical protein|tara:strand:+ start:214 stop:423 length:210 start_codon:yes stop_codon:yes gene_type:complete